MADQGAAAPKPGLGAKAERLLPEIAVMAVVGILWLARVGVKDTYQYVEPLALTVTRFLLILLIAVVALSIHHRKTGESVRVDRADLPRLILAGLTGYAFYQLGYVLGLDRSTAFASSVLGSLTPVYTIVLLALVGEKTPLNGWVGTFISFCGALVFIAGNGSVESGSLSGNLLLAAAPLSFAIYSIISRPLMRRYSSPVFTVYTLVFGTIPLFIIGAPQWIEQDWSALPTRTWFVILYLAIFPVYLAYQFWNYGIKHLGVTTVSAFSLLIPVLGGIFAVVFLDETFTALNLVGGALVLLGLVVMRMTRR